MSPRNDIARRRAGFTLVEVMVTIFLVSLLCLGIFAGLQQISKAMLAVAIRDEGYHLLQDKVERLLAADFSNFTATGADESITSAVKTSFSPSTAVALSIPADNAAGRITFVRRVVAVASTDSTTTLRAEVQWTWQGRTTVISAPLFRAKG